MKDRCCNECKRNPKAELRDYFYDRGYIPTCKFGYGDCVLNPDYLEKYYDDKNADCSGCKKIIMKINKILERAAYE